MRRLLVKFLDTPLAPILLSFIIIFLYALISGTEFYTALYGAAFFSIIGGWIFTTPITYILHSILDSK